MKGEIRKAWGGTNSRGKGKTRCKNRYQGEKDSSLGRGMLSIDNQEGPREKCLVWLLIGVGLEKQGRESGQEGGGSQAYGLPSWGIC